MKFIPGYENLYSIDECGNLFSCRRQRLLTLQLNEAGYLRFTLIKNHIKFTTMIHRLVALTYIDNPSNYPEVNHIDGNKLNNHVSNLEWCTRLQNMQHAYATGLADRKVHAGRIVSEETKRKMSEAQKGEKHHNYGKNLSEEHRQKIKDAFKIKRHPGFGKCGADALSKKSVKCITTGVVYPSIKLAGIDLGIDPSSISKCCRGIQRSILCKKLGIKTLWEYFNN